jgi:hypothetical protein
MTGENFITRSSPSIRIMKSRTTRWTGGHLARMGQIKNLYKILIGKPERMRTFGRPKRRWVDNIKVDLTELGWEEVDSSDSIKGLEFFV